MRQKKINLFKKTIEIYDGNWSSHNVCPIGYED